MSKSQTFRWMICHGIIPNVPKLLPSPLKTNKYHIPPEIDGWLVQIFFIPSKQVGPFSGDIRSFPSSDFGSVHVQKKMLAT